VGDQRFSSATGCGERHRDHQLKSRAQESDEEGANNDIEPKKKKLLERKSLQKRGLLKEQPQGYAASAECLGAKLSVGN